MSRIVVKLSPNHPNLTLIEVGENDLGLKLIKDNIGESDGKALMECVYRAFPMMPDIVIICDDSGMLKQLPVVLDTSKGLIAGDILICEMGLNLDGERDLYGMSIETAAEVIKMLFPEGMEQVVVGG